MKMLKDNVLITEVQKEEQTAGGIILTSNISKANQPGLVQTVGPDCVGLSQGDRVFLDWTKSMPVDVNGNSAVIISSEYIKAVL